MRLSSQDGLVVTSKRRRGRRKRGEREKEKLLSHITILCVYVKEDLLRKDRCWLLAVSVYTMCMHRTIEYIYLRNVYMTVRCAAGSRGSLLSCVFGWPTDL